MKSNFRLALSLLLLALAPAAPSAAQQPGRWEVEVHGGAALSPNKGDGTGQLPPAGESFTTFVGASSRRSSSWYFGDGAALLNEINGALRVLSRIVPLDSALTRSSIERDTAGSFGARVGYALTPQLTAELSVDATQPTTGFSDAFRDAVEASRASFITAWNGLISSGGGVVFTNSSVTSTAVIDKGSARQIFTTGALKVNLARSGPVVPYVTVGAGLVSNAGHLPSVVLTGNYRFNSLNVLAPGTFPVNEADTVTIRAVARNSPVTLLGGGVSVMGSPRWGVRADARAYLNKNTVDLLVDADPQVTTQTPTGAIASGTFPSMQFSNNPSRYSSSLSGPKISGFKTFTGSGVQVQIGVTGGVFVRF